MPAASPMIGTRPTTASSPTRRLMPGITNAESMMWANCSSRSSAASRLSGSARKRVAVPSRRPKAPLGNSRVAKTASLKAMAGLRGMRVVVMMQDVALPGASCKHRARTAVPLHQKLLRIKPARRSRAASRVASCLAKHSLTRLRTAPCA